ncbi:MAG: histidine kinase [Bacteroidia bacterium]|jgi:signal transduction histidine kinase
MTTPPPAAASGWQRFLGALSGGGVGTAIGLAITAAVMLNPIFLPPFPVLLGRTLFLALALLLAYAAARAWPRAGPLRWLPAWLAPVVALAVVAPLATLAIYLQSTGGNFVAFVNAPGRIAGFMWIAGSGLFLSLLVALGAMLREREAQGRTQALQFELERSRLEKQAVDARLSLLQAQIEPHFLFNTLANVQALVENNSPRAADVLKSLIAYLRAAMPRLHDGQPTLGNELALVRAYLELMQMRMPDRLQFGVDIDSALLNQRFPPMSLLTLVENAVRHGIDPSEDGGRIEVGAAADAAGLRVWVSDSGVGMDPRAEPGTGIGNLRARLQGFFGPAARLQIEERQPRGMRAEIVISA